MESLWISRAGYAGALAAWAGFTLPSAVVLIVLARGLDAYGHGLPPSALHGLKLVAVAVDARAVWGMARTLCPDTPRLTIMAVATCFVHLVPSAWTQVAVIAIAAIVGLALFRPQAGQLEEGLLPFAVPRRSGMFCLTLFFVLLIA